MTPLSKASDSAVRVSSCTHFDTPQSVYSLQSSVLYAAFRGVVRQQIVHHVLYGLALTMVIVTLVTFSIDKSICMFYGYANISRLGLLPLLTYYVVEGGKERQLQSISLIHAILAFIDLLFTVFFIVLDNYFDHVRPYYYSILSQSTQPPPWMLDDFYRELTVPFWYRQLCILLGLPSLMQGLLGVVLAYLIKTLKRDQESYYRNFHCMEKKRLSSYLTRLHPVLTAKGTPPGILKEPHEFLYDPGSCATTRDATLHAFMDNYSIGANSSLGKSEYYPKRTNHASFSNDMCPKGRQNSIDSGERRGSCLHSSSTSCASDMKPTCTCARGSCDSRHYRHYRHRCSVMESSAVDDVNPPLECSYSQRSTERYKGERVRLLHSSHLPEDNDPSSEKLDVVIHRV